MSRPAASPDGPRTEAAIQVRLSAVERACVEAAAGKAEVKLSPYARDAVLAAARKDGFVPGVELTGRSRGRRTRDGKTAGSGRSERRLEARKEITMILARLDLEDQLIVLEDMLAGASDRGGVT